MFLFQVAKENASTLLCAMRAVARADGEETAKETALLEVVRDALSLPGSVDDYEPLAADADLLARISVADRPRVVQAMLLMALMDGSGSRAEAEVVETFARLLQVDEPRVNNLRQLAERRLERMKWDLTRKGYAKDEFLRTAKEEGLKGLYKTFGPLVGLAEDPDTARRYNDLGKLQEGTLGRAYWEFIVNNELAFPGEPRAVAERGTWHDLSHVLGGYPITPLGETLVVAFIAGYRREDPFFWLFTIALQFQVGVRISPFSQGAHDAVDPELFVRHHLRGSQVRRDLSEGWDFWADFPRPLGELRRELNVLPAST